MLGFDSSQKLHKLQVNITSGHNHVSLSRAYILQNFVFDNCDIVVLVNIVVLVKNLKCIYNKSQHIDVVFNAISF